MFDNWIQSVKESTWAVPYEVYQLEKDASPEDFTMDAVLIGDIIMDEYFYQLTDYYSPNISCPLDCYPVASSVKHHNPNLESIIRTRIANKDELIKQYLREEVESIG